MRLFLAAALIAAAAPLAAQTSPAAAPAQAPAAKYSSGETEIGTLLDDPAARAILNRHLPGLADSEQIGMARGMTLKAIQPYATDTITDDILAKVDADFAKLPK